MPTPVLLLLTVLVGVYVVLAGTAFVGFLLARGQDPPPAPSEWPKVSVVVPGAEDPDDETIEQIRTCDYPTAHLDILAQTDHSANHSSGGSNNEEAVRRVSVPNRSPAHGGPVGSETGIEAVKGDVRLSMPAEGTVTPGWVRSMARRCTPETPVVVGPTIVEHEGLFLPRLQALSHLGRHAFTTGLSHMGIPSHLEASNRAACADAPPANAGNGAVSEQTRGNSLPAVHPATDALVARPPVSSFGAFLQRLGQGFRRVLSSASWLVRGQGIGLWLLHSALLACGLVAVAVPAWRQPTLLALVTLMGANVVLTLPAAKHYGQRGLLRSLVPTVLMLVFALPVAGLWALVGHFQESGPVPLRGDA